MMPLFLSVIGLAIDGGIAFNTRRALQNVADAAARAGAMQIDRGVYRETSGGTVVLDTAGAREVAAAYLGEQGMELSAAIVAEPRRVTVQVSREVPTIFLRLVGIRTMRISATAPAEVRHGIEQGIR
jgi:Flp pilus assembly protein TadG